MGKFVYKAWDENFKIINAIIEADNIQSAKEKLKNQGLKIIDVKKQSNLTTFKAKKKILKDEELANFCGQIGIVLNAGVNIVKGLEIIQDENKKLKKVILNILSGVKRGQTLSKSMEGTGVFSKLLVDTVMSGEISGNVDEILFNMEQFYRREASIKSKIKGAAIYPAILLVSTIGMLVFFNFYIFPNMKSIFEGNVKLPFITRMLMDSNKFISDNIIGIVVVTFFSILLLSYLKDLPKIRYELDKLTLKIPIWGKIKMYMITSRFTRSMNIFLRSAVPLLEALDNLTSIVGNTYIGHKIELVKNDIINGRGIGNSLEEKQIFDSLVIHMILIGEETGKLEEMLSRLADIYDKKTEAGISKMMVLMEPMFTLIIGIVVAVIVVALALPIINMTNNIQ